MKHGNDIILGTIAGGSTPFSLSREARSMHLYIAGATGTGKSKLLENCIRSDISRWSCSRCGLMLLDPHGALYDGVVEYLAQNDLQHVPVVPLDLRRNDWVVSYNFLRPRPHAEADMAVVIGNFVRAIAYAWGVPDLSATPLLARWLWTILASLYEERLTLGESLHLIRNRDFRRKIAAKVTDPIARTTWEISRDLKESEFQEQLSSTVNRIVKFLSTEVMRAMLCQTGLSLDLSAAMRKGSIVLVSLATAGSRVDEEDAAALGCVLLADLWTAAKSRGKHEAGPAELVKPFYVYVDEFQEFVTPAMAKTLDQARGFGLHMTLAHQTPRQLLARGNHGQQLFDSIMANARTKAIFQMDHPDDLPILAQWLYRNQINPDSVKYQGYSTKVIGHTLTYVPSYSSSETHGTSAGENTSDTASESVTLGTNHSETASETTTESLSNAHTENRGTNKSRSTARSRGQSEGMTEGESDTESDQFSSQNSRSASEGQNWSDTEGTSTSGSSGHTRSTSVTRGIDDLSDDEMNEIGNDYRELLNTTRPSGKPSRKKVERLDDATRRVSLGETVGDDQSSVQGTSNSRAKGGSRGNSETSGESEAHGKSRSLSRSRSSSQDESSSESESDGSSAGSADTTTFGKSTSTGLAITDGTSDASTKGNAHMVGKSFSTQHSMTVGQSSSPMLIPVMGQEATTPVFRSVEEQTFIATQVLSSLPQRHFVVRTAEEWLPTSLVTPFVQPARTVRRRLALWIERRYAKVPFAIKLADAIRSITERHSTMQSPPEDDDMPTTAKRRVRRPDDLP